MSTHRVTFTVDVEAAGPRLAAEKALRVLSSPGGLESALCTTQGVPEGHRKTIDLTEGAA